MCVKYAVIREPTVQQETEICGSNKRITSVYLSTTYELDVYFIPSYGSQNNNFLMKYEGTEIYYLTIYERHAIKQI